MKVKHKNNNIILKIKLDSLNFIFLSKKMDSGLQDSKIILKW